MSLAPRLDLRQSQSLVMTPQLQQAIKLLALSNLELEGFIAEEVERNPLLEAGREGEGVSDTPLPVEAAPADATAPDGDTALDVDVVAERFDDELTGRAGLDGSLGLAGTGGGSTEGSEAPDLDAFANAELSLADHLLAQIGAIAGGTELTIAHHIIDQLDAAGYLTVPLREIADRLGVALARVEAALALVQTLDPTGVGARDLAECLALQAAEADRYDPCMARLIDNLDLLARGELKRLQRMCAVDEEDMADMIRELRGYDPKPGLRYGGEVAPAVIPDVYVARTGNGAGGGWAIELNAATLPRVLVDRSYYVELSGGQQDKASKAWLGEMLASANWLVKALDQRQRTIVRVVTEIVKQQEGFFRHGVEQLRPLTLKQVAEAIEMHESTVSRVTSNKYLSCARGLFELKYFFTSAIQAADGGEAASALAVKAALKALIQAETEVLSDDTLVELLQARGFDIARRTVAKYREALGIGSSIQRRRAKKLAA